jgi:HD-GYP domain-containing protein (c-di-GMP phosphodiesterase class II)
MGSTLKDRFDVATDSRASSASLRSKGEVTRLCASLKERLVAGSAASFDFVNSAFGALARLRGSTHAELRMECLEHCTLFFYTNGFSRSAFEAARALDALATSHRDERWIRRAKSTFGAMAADVGDVGEALVHLELALSLARKLQERLSEARALNNLGAAFTYAGLNNEAMACFQQSAHVASSEGLKDHAAIALANIAQIHLYNEEYAKGLDAISRSLLAMGEPNNTETALNRTINEFVYVQIAVGLGKFDLARVHLEACKRFSLWSGSSRSAFLAAVAEGLCEIHCGNVPVGISRLESALESIEKANHFRITCLTALVKGCEAAGQPEKALQYMEKLLHEVSSKKAESVRALMALHPAEGNDAPAIRDSLNIDALTRRELKLRAVVAQRELNNSRIEMLERLAVTADIKEDASGEHGYRVGKLASLLADELDWSREASTSLELAARLHDIGKIGVPDRILLSSQQLKEAERHFIGTHTAIGAELLANGNMPQLRMAEDVARYHHEWWDGTGYPSKLRGKRIPIHARIVALADVFDALTHGRPYSEAWPIDKALEEIRNRRGTQFDPDLTDRFLDLVARLLVEHKDLDAFLAKAALNSPFAQARNKIRSMLAEEHANERRAKEPEAETVH